MFKNNNIKLGYLAGNLEKEFEENTNRIAIGLYAGYRNQQSNTVAIGNNAGYDNQQPRSVAIGNLSGAYGQQSNSVAICYAAGYDNQQSDAIAIGTLSGTFNQQSDSVAIGRYAGHTNLGLTSIAIGLESQRYLLESSDKNFQGYNVSLGGNSLKHLGTGFGNTCLGVDAGRDIYNGNLNVAVGRFSLCSKKK